MTLTDEFFDSLRLELEIASDREKAASMAAYMKNKFSFFGVSSADRRRLEKPLLAAAVNSDESQILEIAERCWDDDHRELHYVATDVLRKTAANLGPGSLPRIRKLIETNSWWDTVDSVAAWTVGPLVFNNPQLASDMDDWIDDENIWVARTAILHQLSFKESTDAARLFAYAQIRATDTEFFIRKAIGWALRQFARVEPDSVREFVAANPQLSGLTRREAMKHL